MLLAKASFRKLRFLMIAYRMSRVTRNRADEHDSRNSNQKKPMDELLTGYCKYFKRKLRMPQKTLIAIAACLFHVTLPGFSQFISIPTTGAPPLSGTVVGDNGKPVQAIVTALKVGLPLGTGRAVSAADGSFTMSGLINGKYQLCVVDKTGDYLDPCTWSAAGGPAVVIDATKPISNYRLVVIKGTPLQVRVNDTGKLLVPAAASKSAPATLMISILTTHHTLQMVPVTSTDAVGRTHQIAVPANANSQLHFFGRGLSVSDETGKKLDTEKGDLLLGRYLPHSGSPYRLWSNRCTRIRHYTFDDVLIGYGIDSNCLLSEAIEEHASVPRSATVEPEGEFIKVIVQMLMCHRPLVGAHKPSL